jgi:hypothetical protein
VVEVEGKWGKENKGHRWMQTWDKLYRMWISKHKDSYSTIGAVGWGAQRKGKLEQGQSLTVRGREKDQRKYTSSLWVEGW